MRKKTIVIILTVLVFVAAAVLGTATVFRVRSVEIKAAVISNAATEEVKDLQQRLTDAYEKDSTFFVDNKKAKRITEEFPYFRITGFEKSYPDKVILYIAEEAEVFAVKKADSDEYYIVGADGMILAVRASMENRLDGQPNILVDGEGLCVTGQKGEKLVGGDKITGMIAFCNVMAEGLNGLRDNVVGITLADYGPDCLITREGVKIYVGDSHIATAEKAEAVLEKYLSLTDAQRMKGSIKVDAPEGSVLINYSETDLGE